MSGAWTIAHRAYPTWKGMMRRCGLRTGRSEKDEKIYKGVSVCDEWKDFYTFEEWLLSMGWKYRGGVVLVLVDKTKDFSPDNCILTTMAEAQDFRRNVTRVNGVSVRKAMGLPPTRSRELRNAQQRVRSYGWSLKDAISMPAIPRSMLNRIKVKKGKDIR